MRVIFTAGVPEEAAVVLHHGPGREWLLCHLYSGRSCVTRRGRGHTGEARGTGIGVMRTLKGKEYTKGEGYTERERCTDEMRCTV